ncbi:lysoplasmalogenase [Paenibacillus qinlingensis]|uniref:Membrane protein YhhN n=1 Tax=Paenibacillus qinlingensis TaxID=1837343 RepID=A0ABU1NUP4_9BACL|nr:lysoplasmalogenase [Paenibacillus qinlingensis]MDR6550552.1 putative membrane protein YhhN [Paenibacillus qinlingensis]
MMKKIGLPVCIVGMSLLYIFFIPSDPTAVKLLFKLIPMWLIMWYAYLQIPIQRQRYHMYILIGLFFCMLGDGLLSMFVIGLSAFLIGHLFYTASFLQRWSFSKLRFAVIIPLTLYGLIMGRELLHALVSDGKEGLIVPVLLYLIVISFMAFSAIMTGHPWAILGSLLFVVSDSILSWNMFISDVTYSGPLIMTSYYAAQFLLAYSLGKSSRVRTSVGN